MKEKVYLISGSNVLYSDGGVVSGKLLNIASLKTKNYCNFHFTKMYIQYIKDKYNLLLNIASLKTLKL